MRFNPAPLIRLVGSRSFALTIIVASIAVTVAHGLSGAGSLVTAGPGGFGLPGPGKWLGDTVWSLIAAIGLELLILTAITQLNRGFNLIRGLPAGSMLWGAMFMLFQSASPGAGSFSGGLVLALVAVVSTALFYSVYQQPLLTRRILLIFVMFGAGVLFDYGCIPYFAVLVIGCIQMRVMNLRTIIALVAGTLVPAWVLGSFGLIELDRFITPVPVNIFASGSLASALPVVVTALVTITACCFAQLLDMLQIYARNARTRAFFGLIATTGLMTSALCIIDFGNIEFYTPLLNLTTAYFVTLLFSLRKRGATGPGTTLIAFLTLIFIGLCLWTFTASLASSSRAASHLSTIASTALPM